MTGFLVLKRAGAWLSAAAMLPTLAVAQSIGAAPQSTPPVTFSLPPSTRPTPAPIPTSGPIIAPLSRPTPTPTPSILNIPTPTATPAAKPSYSGGASAGVATKRQVTGVVTVPTPAPTADATPVPTPTVVATPAGLAPPEPITTAPPPAVQPAGGWPPGLLIAIGAGLLALVAVGGFLLGRRRSAREEEAIEEVVAEPVAAPPVPVSQPSGNVTVPARRGVTEEPQPRLEIALIPKRAGMNLMGAAVDYRLIVRNSGPVAARDVRFAMYMLSASARQAQDLQMVFAAAIDQPMIAPFDLAPGADIDLSGMAMLPREQVNVMTIDGRPWFVPVLAMKADYRWGDNVGAPGVATAAHMIGIDRGEGAKMAPFRLDGGPHMHPEVAERKVA